MLGRVMHIRSLILVSLLVLACSMNDVFREKLLSRVRVDQAREPAALFVAEYPDCLHWSWESTHEVSALATFTINNLVYIGEEGEHWKCPLETWYDGGGDCDDFAIFQCAMLRYLGCSGTLLLVYGYHYGKCHMWVEIYPQGEGCAGHLLDSGTVWVLDPVIGQTRGAFGYSVELIAEVPR